MTGRLWQGEAAGSDFIMDGGVTAAYWYGHLSAK